MSNNQEFRPVNQAHAIAEMVLFFEFLPDLSSVIPALMSLQDELKASFPRAEKTQSFKFDLQPGPNVVSQQVSGLQLSRFRTDGSPGWVININEPAISFHCMDYTRWQSIWDELRLYVTHVFQVLGAAPITISSVGLKYVDRFVWGGLEENYDAKLLFKRDAPLLHPRAFISASRWHCHTGWYQQELKKEEILHQLNIDSGRHLLSGAPAVIVNIDHTQIIRSVLPDQLAKYGDLSETTAPLDELLNQLHISNKSVLSSLLSNEMGKRINLS